MENNNCSEETRPQCLLCENDNVSDLVQCSFCNQVWYCDEKEENYENSPNANGHVNGTIVEDSRSNTHSEKQSTLKSANKKLRYHGYPHRPLGLNYCQPFKVSKRPGKGRVLEASRNIKEGELVVVDKALAVLPDAKPVCLGCLEDISSPFSNRNEFPNSSEPSTCSTCGFPMCGKNDCDKSKWHSRHECSALAKADAANKLFKSASTINSEEIQEFELSPEIRINQFYHVIAILRFILAQQSCSNVIREQIELLMDHNDTRLKEKGGGWIMKHINNFIKEDCQFGTKVEYRDITRAFGVMQTNSMSLVGLQGKAVYPTVSLMSHSCYNNLTIAAGPGEGVAFKAIRSIKSGEELTIRYLDLKRSHNQIRQELFKNWKFWCECERCSDPTELNTYLSSPLCEVCSHSNKPNDKQSKIVESKYQTEKHENGNDNPANVEMEENNGGDKCKIACYIPINPLDISSDWKCTICDHTIGPGKVHEFEEVAEKIISSGHTGLIILPTSEKTFGKTLTKQTPNVNMLVDQISLVRWGFVRTEPKRFL